MIFSECRPCREHLGAELCYSTMVPCCPARHSCWIAVLNDSVNWCQQIKLINRFTTGSAGSFLAGCDIDAVEWDAIRCVWLTGRVYGRRGRVSTAVVAFTARPTSERREAQSAALYCHGKLPHHRIDFIIMETTVTTEGVVTWYVPVCAWACCRRLVGGACEVTGGTDNWKWFILTLLD